MDIATTIIASISIGIAMASAAYVFATRELYSDDLKERVDLRAEFQQTLHKMVQEHNKLVLQVSETADRMSDLSIRNAMGKKT